MNVLILSASAKVLLVRAFQEAVRPFGGLVLASDLDPLAPAVAAADGTLELPRSDDPAFAPSLLAACRRQRIDLVVPTRDPELGALATLAPNLAENGTWAAAPSPESVRICRDKHAFARHCRDSGLPLPRTIEGTPDHWPVFVKPRFGAASVGARAIPSAEDLAHALREAPDLVVQEMVTAPEYSIDVLSDFEGEPLQAVVRERVRVRAGESVVSRIDNIPELEAVALDLARSLRLVGHSVVQAFRGERGALLIEANPRFGGASNLAIAGGLASPERMIALLRGDPTARAPRPILYGLTMLRHSADILVDWSKLGPR